MGLPPSLSRSRESYSFTLVELLVVIGILAILTAAIVIVLNPTELLKQGRDPARMTDLATISKAAQVLLSQNPSVSLGTASTVYVSLPDNASSTCGSLGLPILPAGYSYHCVPSASSTLMNGSGWLPIDFSSSPVQNLARLPLDPLNASSSLLYYSYIPDPSKGTFAVAGFLESKKYLSQAQADGGYDPERIERGSDASLIRKAYGLVGYWPFDGNSNDASGNNNNGIWRGSGSVRYGIGKIGQAGQFNGIDDYVGVDSNSYSLIGSSSFSIAAWVKLNVNPSVNPRVLAYAQDANNFYNLVAYGGSGYNSFVFETKKSGSTYGTGLNDSFYQPNTWYFVTGVFNNESNASYFYMNGSLRSAGFGCGCAIASAMNRLSIGSSSGAAGESVNGSIDDVRVYNRALSAAEIQAIYNAER